MNALKLETTLVRKYFGAEVLKHLCTTELLRRRERSCETPATMLIERADPILTHSVWWDTVTLTSFSDTTIKIWSQRI